MQHNDNSGGFDTLLMDVINRTNYSVLSSMAEENVRRFSNLERSWLIRLWLEMCLQFTEPVMTDVVNNMAFTVLTVVRDSDSFMEMDKNNAVTMLNKRLEEVTKPNELPSYGTFHKAAILITLTLNNGDLQ